MKSAKKLSPAQVAKISDMDLMMQIARESLQKYGTAIPPDNVVSPSVRTPKRKPAVDWKKETHTCPKCGTYGTVADVFGIRSVRGEEKKQSYCAKCRATLNYYNVPRKYKKD